jgi:hypothetical protein
MRNVGAPTACGANETAVPRAKRARVQNLITYHRRQEYRNDGVPETVEKCGESGGGSLATMGRPQLDGPHHGAFQNDNVGAPTLSARSALPSSRITFPTSWDLRVRQPGCRFDGLRGRTKSQKQELGSRTPKAVSSGLGGRDDESPALSGTCGGFQILLTRNLGGEYYGTRGVTLPSSEKRNLESETIGVRQPGCRFCDFGSAEL